MGGDFIYPPGNDRLGDWANILDDTRFESCGGEFFRQRREIQIEVDPFTEPVFADNHASPASGELAQE